MNLENIGNAVESPKKMLGLAVVGVVGYVGIKAIQRSMNKAAAAELAAKSGSSITVSQAAALYGAMHEAGFMNSGWGTDEAAIFRVAGDITDLPKVQSDYRVLYPGRELMTDLREELSGSDYNKFVAIIQSVTPGSANNTAVRSQPEGTRNNPQGAKLTRNNIVLSKREVRMRQTTADKTAFDWTRADTFSARAFLGYTTGRTIYNSTDNIYYMEVWFYDSAKAKKTAWVTTSKEFVGVYPYWKHAFDATPAGVRLMDRAKDAQGRTQATSLPLSGLGSMVDNLYPRLITTDQVKIRDRSLQFTIRQAGPNEILGRFIKEIIRANGTRLTQFLDSANRIRHVESYAVTFYKPRIPQQA